MAISDSPKIRRVPLFRSSHQGYGDARRYLGGREYSYNRVGGSPVDMRWPGEIREGARLFVEDTVDHDNPPIFAAEWEDTSANPLIGYVVDNLVKKIANTAVSTFVTLTAVATCAAMHDDGSGVPYLFTGYGGTSALGKIQSVNRAGTQATSTNIYADKMLSLSNDLYITATPSSGTASCSIGKIAAGSNPASAAFPTLTRVGNAARKINNVVAVRYAPICLKPEGIFAYDRDSDTWVNHARWLEYMPHPDNGKRYWYEGTDLIVAMGMGGAVRFDGYDAWEYDLLGLNAMPNLDTTSQLIAAGGTLRHWGVAVTQTGAKRQRKGGGTAPDTQATTLVPLQFGKTVDSGANYTSYSTNVTDGDPATVATLDALDTVANGDWIIIGHQHPFVGFYLDVSTPNSNVAAMNTQIWNGAAWTTTPVAVDLTAITANSKTLGRAGWVIMAGGDTGDVSVDLVRDPAYNWQPSSITIGGTAFVRYWARVSVNSALSATVRIKGVELLPYIPSMDYVNFPADSLDRSGGFSHILLSRSEGEEHIVHDMGLCPRVDEIGCVLWGLNAASGTINDDRSLVLFGKRRIQALLLSLDDKPQMYQWPSGNNGTTACSVELAALDAGNDVQVSQIIVEGRDFQRTGYFYYRWDDGVPWRLAGSFNSLPKVLTITNADTGRYLHTCVAWTATAAQERTPGTPVITAIDADLIDMPRPAQGHLSRTTSAPMV